MPWCEPCEKWRAPNAVMPDGSCPRCRTQMQEGAVATEAAEAAEARASVKIPWHFWVMVASAALYLGWRAVQGLIALF